MLSFRDMFGVWKMNRKNFMTKFVVAVLLGGILTLGTPIKVSAASPTKPSHPVQANQQKKEDIVLACKVGETPEKRMAAINRIAQTDDWQTLSQILLYVTKRHDIQMQEIKKTNPVQIARNENNILDLGIDELVVLKSLSRIGNPGAIPYVLEFRRIRSSQGNLRSGEYWAAIDKTAKDLREKMLGWEPESDSNKKKL